MKKIYMPTDEVLSKMQDMGANVYKYIVVKSIESLIANGINYPQKGMLKNAYNYLLGNQDIVHGVCLLYPDEIKYSDLAKYDIQLLEQLIRKSRDDQIYNLNVLSEFTSSSFENWIIVKKVIELLAENLPNRPEYRFEYRENELLDKIFSTKILERILIGDMDTFSSLVSIDPAYAIIIPREGLDGFTSRRIHDEEIKKLLISGINKYASRYQVGSSIPNTIYAGENVLQLPETKKLVKAIRRNKDILY